MSQLPAFSAFRFQNQADDFHKLRVLVRPSTYALSLLEKCCTLLIDDHDLQRTALRVRRSQDDGSARRDRPIFTAIASFLYHSSRR